MQKVIILRGLPFSGKTTWAKKFNDKQGRRFVIFNFKDVMANLKSQYPMMEITELRDAADQKLIKTLTAGYSTIIDYENILTTHLTRIIQCIKQANERSNISAFVQVKEMHTPLWLCIKRAQQEEEYEMIKDVVARYYRYCVRKKIIYSNEENSKTDL